MTHFRSLDDLALQNAWLTIGVFDGVHRGHRQLLERLVEGARRAASPSVVVTFYPHPAVVLGGQKDFAYLSLPDEKAALLSELGVEHVVTLPFDRALAQQSAETFMDRVWRAIGLRHLLIGHDFALGRGRQGDAARLTDIGRRLGYTVEVFAPVRREGAIISSTAIRAALAAGRVAEAAALLGRPYALSGPVIHGDGRGRHINIPTANLQIAPEKLIPGRGIYAAWAWVGGERRPAAVNIGVNPTFTPSRQTVSVEAHLLDFSGNLYGRELRLEFIEWLRGEQKFPSVEALLAQIQADIGRVRKILIE